jgi:hypothetical protein
MNKRPHIITSNVLAKSSGRFNTIKQAQYSNTSGRGTGLGPGKTLMQPDNTWDEIAKSDSGVASWAKRNGKDLDSVKFTRVKGKDGKNRIYADGVEMTSASMKTEGYADNAPTRAQINASKNPSASQASSAGATSIPGVKESSPAGTGVDERAIAPNSVTNKAKEPSKAPAAPAAPAAPEKPKGESPAVGGQVSTSPANSANTPLPAPSAPSSPSAPTPPVRKGYFFPRGAKGGVEGYFGPFESPEGKKRYFKVVWNRSSRQYEYTGDFEDR